MVGSRGTSLCDTAHLQSLFDGRRAHVAFELPQQGGRERSAEQAVRFEPGLNNYRLSKMHKSSKCFSKYPDFGSKITCCHRIGHRKQYLIFLKNETVYMLSKCYTKRLSKFLCEKVSR